MFFNIRVCGTHYLVKFLGVKFKLHSRKLFNELCKNPSPEKIIPLLTRWYFINTGKLLNLEEPKTINEKIQWMKLYDLTPLKSELADKYAVREYVKEKIGEEYLIPLIGVWDKFEDIDFNILPEKFVLKCTHGSGYNIICSKNYRKMSKIKQLFYKNKCRKKIKKWLSENFAFKFGYEMHYNSIKPRIIAEEYIENTNENLYDYKFWCFDGRVKFVQFLTDRTTVMKGAFYDRNWNKQEFVSNSYELTDVEKPDNLDKMIDLAEKLSHGFNFVRVDLYRMDNGKIYFGEMTFTPSSGAFEWNPPEYDLKLGQMIKLNYNYNNDFKSSSDSNTIQDIIANEIKQSNISKPDIQNREQVEQKADESNIKH